MDLCVTFTARNEVGARLCFHRHVWFCSQGGGLPRCMLGYHPPPGADSPGRGHPPPPDSVHRGGGLPQCMLGYHPPGADTPRSRHPPCPPAAEHAGRYGQRAGGTHPTGMQSCFKSLHYCQIFTIVSYHSESNMFIYPPNTIQVPSL